MASYQKKVKLEFVDLRLTIKKREVLRGVSGAAEPGQLLAVMGPSGAGKTLLLNCLAGRQSALDSGDIFLNGQPLSKRLRRQISFVLQEDLFLSELTLRETLKFTADLRLPSRMTDEEKKQKIQNIIDTLDLNKCLDTKIGNSLERGLSGGEKKRANIGCELLTDPSILLLDEPTSGLDSRTACELLKTLKEYTILSGKTVITSIHQPSSRVFHLFDRLLLLSEGQVVYFGDALQVVDYFARLGLHCPQHYNPADYIIDIVKGTAEERDKIHAAAKTQSWNCRYYKEHSPDSIVVPVESLTENESSGLQRSINRALSIGGLQDGSFDNSVFVDYDVDEAGEHVRRPSTSNVAMLINNSNTNGNASHHQCVRASLNTASLSLELQVKTTKESHKYHIDSCDRTTLKEEKWPTGYWHQLRTLTHRNFKQNRHLVLSKLYVFKQVAIALLVGALWFQISFAEKNVRDISGILFFMSAYWGFESIFSSLTTFQLERDVVAKERSAGAYRLSAYYMSKVIGVLPLLSSLAVGAGTISFWMTGLHDSGLVFVCFVGTLVLYVQAGQAIGRFLSAISSSIDQAITAASLTMLSSMLLGGFYVQNLPWWLQWLRYTSITSYVYGAYLSIVFVLVPQNVSCNTTIVSEFGDCLSTSTADDMNIDTSTMLDTVASNATAFMMSTHGSLDGDQIVKALVNFSFPFWAYYMTLLGFAVVLNFLAYLVLRFCRTNS